MECERGTQENTGCHDCGSWIRRHSSPVFRVVHEWKGMSMSNELSISSLGELVKDKVRAAIVGSIPEPTIQALIEKEFKALTEKRYNYDERSPLGKMIYEEIENQYKEKVKIAVSLYLNEQKVNGKDLAQQAIAEMAPLIISKVAAFFAQESVHHLQQNIANGNNYRGY